MGDGKAAMSSIHLSLGCPLIRPQPLSPPGAQAPGFDFPAPPPLCRGLDFSAARTQYAVDLPQASGTGRREGPSPRGPTPEEEASMPLIDGVYFCDRCGAEIVGSPVIRENRRHCCQDCANGLPCDCALILEDDRRESGEAASE